MIDFFCCLVKKINEIKLSLSLFFFSLQILSLLLLAFVSYYMDIGCPMSIDCDGIYRDLCF